MGIRMSSELNNSIHINGKTLYVDYNKWQYYNNWRTKREEGIHRMMRQSIRNFNT